MLFYVLTILMNAVASTILGVVVYLRNRNQLVNRLFALFCLAVALWSYCYFFALIVTEYGLALFWWRALMAAAIFIPLFYFQFVLALLNKIKENRKYLIFGYFIFLFFFLADFTPFFLEKISPKLFFPFWGNPGVLFHPFLLIWFLYLFAAIYLLIKEIHILSNEEDEKGDEDEDEDEDKDEDKDKDKDEDLKIKKVQLKYILTGTIIGFGGAAANYFLWYDIPIPPCTNFLVSVGLGIIVYGIMKYQLFNVKVIVSELLVFAIWAFTIIRTVLSKSYEELLINIGFTILVFIITLLLIRSVYKEGETDKKLLEQTKRLLEHEKKLKEDFRYAKEETERRFHDYFMRHENLEKLELEQKILILARKVKGLERELEKKEKELNKYQKKTKKKKGKSD